LMAATPIHRSTAHNWRPANEQQRARKLDYERRGSLLGLEVNQTINH
jgi:hypothetical protein